MRRSALLYIAGLVTAGLAFAAGVFTERYVFAPSAPAPPALLTPADGAVLPNGKGPDDTSLVWEFRWSRVPGARQYRICVIHGRTEDPMADEVVQEPHLRLVRRGHWVGEPNLTGWRWRVKAEFERGWSEWSEDRTFDIEPPKG